jgi:hypothetical protein
MCIEIRRPNSEGRKKAEGRSPKERAASAHASANTISRRMEGKVAGVCFSEFGLFSSFGIRVSDFAMPLNIAKPA